MHHPLHMVRPLSVEEEEGDSHSVAVCGPAHVQKIRHGPLAGRSQSLQAPYRLLLVSGAASGCRSVAPATNMGSSSARWAVPRVFRESLPGETSGTTAGKAKLMACFFSRNSTTPRQLPHVKPGRSNIPAAPAEAMAGQDKASQQRERCPQGWPSLAIVLHCLKVVSSAWMPLVALL